MGTTYKREPRYVANASYDDHINSRLSVSGNGSSLEIAMEWGWKLTGNRWTPYLTTLSEAVKSCYELIHCSCQKVYSDRWTLSLKKRFAVTAVNVFFKFCSA